MLEIEDIVWYRQPTSVITETSHSIELAGRHFERKFTEHTEVCGIISGCHWVGVNFAISFDR